MYIFVLDNFTRILLLSQSLISNYKKFYDEAAFIPQQTDPAEVAAFGAIADMLGKNLSILDIGCAEGKLAAFLAKKGHTVTVCDISESFLLQAKKTAEDQNVTIQTAFCDIDSDISQLQDKKFDLIYFMDIIEHVRSPIIALSHIRSLLKDAGHVVINTPNLSSLSRLYMYMKYPKKKVDFFLPSNLTDLHIQGYDYQTLEKALNFCGLKVLRFFPNIIMLPFIHRFRFAKPFLRWCSKKFPLLSENLCVLCTVTEPLDVEKQLEYWRNGVKKA
jgi:2-polyprenyl-3-methyl-5-hydroxy-6-metoxy-1,4-benzoquinol methylase